MGRSTWKFNTFNASIVRNCILATQLKRIDFFFKKHTTQFKTYKRMFQRLKLELNYTLIDRGSTVPSTYIGNSVTIHKGSTYRKLSITKLNVGYKFGEFAFSRKPFKFPIKIKKKKNLIRR